MASSNPPRDIYARTLAVFERATSPSEPLTTPEIADALGCERRTVYKRLTKLVERGDLQTKKVGASGRVWWQPSPDAGESAAARPADRTGNEASLETERGRFEALVQSVSEYAIFLLDPDGRVRSWNSGAERMKGYAEDEIVGEHVRTFYTAEDREAGVPEENLSIAAEQGVVEDEGWRVRKDGTTFWANVTITAIRDTDGALQGYAKVTRDKTEQREREHRLRRERDELEAELAEVFERIDDGFLALDRDLRFTYVNEHASELLGISEEEVLGRDIRDVIHISDTAEAAYTEALDTQRPVTFEDYYDPLDAWVENQVYPSETGISLYFRDVSEQKRREQQLERYETIVETVNDGIFVVDEHDRFITVNDAYADLVGYDRADLVGAHCSLVMDADGSPSPELIKADLRAGDAGSYTYEAVLETASGEKIAVEATGALLPTEGGTHDRVGIVRDITERKRFEQTLTALHESSRELLQLETQEAVSESVLRTTTDVLGIEGASIYLYDEDAAELVPAAATDYVRGIFGEVPSFGPGDSAITWEAFADRKTITCDDVTDVELAYRDDTPLRSGVWIPLGDHGVLAVVADEVNAFGPNEKTLADLLAATAETALDRVERERQRRRHKQELEAQNERLDRFASMLAHELRNPITIGQIYSQQLPDDADAEATAYIEESFDRLEAMIDIMLVLTRGQDAVGDQTRVQLDAVAREVWDEIETADATLNLSVDRTISADRTYVRHLFRNLFENSVEHGGSDAAVTVGALPSGFYVEDTGRGIPADERDAVFEPGYTTAAEQGGTGLGLAFVRELADVYEWELSVTDSETGGARFEFRNVDQDADRAE